MRQGMRKTRAIVIIALAIVAGIVLAYSPLLLDQTQAIPLTSDRDTPGFEYGASILKACKTNRSPAENVKAMVTGVVSPAGGFCRHSHRVSGSRRMLSHNEEKGLSTGHAKSLRPITA